MWVKFDTKKITCAMVLFAFLANAFGPAPLAQAGDFSLPAPGVRIHLSPEFNPPVLKGIKVHPDNPFKFEFILDRGDRRLSDEALKDESSKLIKYFLASLTIPENDLWVNLSPYEKDRIIPNSFGLTEMGRDLLAEDYMLKQITASLIYPEDQIGKKFWKRIYEEAEKKFGTTDIPVSTFNKVWIVPEKAVVYENAKAGTAYVVESKLKVMLEQDYLSLAKHAIQPPHLPEMGKLVKMTIPPPGGMNTLGSQVIREIVIPELTIEVNENKNFAKLRQVFNSLILATWYKKKIKDSILAQVYADKKKIAGVNIDDPNEKLKIYGQYLKAFKKGVYNYIKEDVDPVTQGMISRKYFSGGLFLKLQMGTGIDDAMSVTHKINPKYLENNVGAFEVKTDFAMLKENPGKNIFSLQTHLPHPEETLRFINWDEIQDELKEISQRLINTKFNEVCLPMIRQITHNLKLKREDFGKKVVFSYLKQDYDRYYFIVSFMMSKQAPIDILLTVTKRKEGKKPYENEINILTQLNGLGVVRHGITLAANNGRLWTFQEFIQGPTLEELKAKYGAFSDDQVRQTLRSLMHIGEEIGEIPRGIEPFRFIYSMETGEVFMQRIGNENLHAFDGRNTVGDLAEFLAMFLYWYGKKASKDNFFILDALSQYFHPEDPKFFRDMIVISLSYVRKQKKSFFEHTEVNNTGFIKDLLALDEFRGPYRDGNIESFLEFLDLLEESFDNYLTQQHAALIIAEPPKLMTHFTIHFVEPGPLPVTMTDSFQEVYGILKGKAAERINQRPEMFIKMLGHVNGDETLKIEDLSGDVEIAYFRENGTKYLFKAKVHRKKGPPLYFVIAVTKEKYHIYPSTFDEESNILTKLNGQGVATVGDFFTGKDGYGWINQAFVEGRPLLADKDQPGLIDKKVVRKVVKCLMTIANVMDGQVPRSIDPTHFIYDKQTGQLVIENWGTQLWKIEGKDSNQIHLASFFTSLLDWYGSMDPEENIYIFDEMVKYFKKEDEFWGIIKAAMEQVKEERTVFLRNHLPPGASAHEPVVSDYEQDFLDRKMNYQVDGRDPILTQINLTIESLEYYLNTRSRHHKRDAKTVSPKSGALFPFTKEVLGKFRDSDVYPKIMEILLNTHEDALETFNKNEEYSSLPEEERKRKMIEVVIDRDVLTTVELLTIDHIKLNDFLAYIAKFTTGPSSYFDGLYIELALQVARNQPKGKLPISAIVVNRKTHEIIIGEKPVYREEKTGAQVEEHAEMNALNKAVRSGWEMSDTDLYVSIESCLNCALGLAANFRPHKIMAAALDDNPFVNGKGLRLLAHERMNSSLCPLPTTRRKGESIIKIYHSLSPIFNGKNVHTWILDRYNTLDDFRDGIQKRINRTFIKDPRTFIDLTILVREFLIAAAVLPPLEAQIVAVDVRASLREAEKDILQAVVRINKYNDHFKVVLLGQNADAVEEFYRSIKGSGIVQAERIFYLDNQKLINCQQKWDSAMGAKGGIDLTPANMNLQTKMDSRFRGNDNEGIKFHLDPAMLVQLQNASGFVPVNISVEPLKNLRSFLETNVLDSR